jgi:hypothetical protein
MGAAVANYFPTFISDLLYSSIQQKSSKMASYMPFDLLICHPLNLIKPYLNPVALTVGG